MKKTNETKNGGYVTIHDGDTSFLDKLLDEDNFEYIPISTANGPVNFEQIATIPFEDNLYVILHPVEPVEGMEEDECIVFRYEQNEEGESLVVEEDEEIAVAIHQQYLTLLEEANDED